MSPELYELSERNMARARQEVRDLAAGTPRTSPIREEVRRWLDCAPRARRAPAGKRRPTLPPRFAELVAQVERAHELSKGDIYLDTNVPSVVAARRDAFVRLREAKLSYPAIACMFGMNHSTVIYHVAKYRELYR